MQSSQTDETLRILAERETLDWLLNSVVNRIPDGVRQGVPDGVEQALVQTGVMALDGNPHLLAAEPRDIARKTGVLTEQVSDRLQPGPHHRVPQIGGDSITATRRS